MLTGNQIDGGSHVDTHEINGSAFGDTFRLSQEDGKAIFRLVEDVPEPQDKLLAQDTVDRVEWFTFNGLQGGDRFFLGDTIEAYYKLISSFVGWVEVMRPNIFVFVG